MYALISDEVELSDNILLSIYVLLVYDEESTVNVRLSADKEVNL